MRAISGVRKALVSAVTTPPKAAPITTPTAMSTTFPRRMNFLKPSNISVILPKSKCRQCKGGEAGGQEVRGVRVSVSSPLGKHCGDILTPSKSHQTVRAADREGHDFNHAANATYVRRL